MIPIKDKKYMIYCQGPYDYNKYDGEGICTGRTDIMDEETVYGFRIPDTTEICYFIHKEIIAEFSDDEKMNANYSPDIQNQIDSENDYCEKCDSCGETGCCPPINCEAVVCKYGDINLKDYRCFQDQWEVMHNALKDIAQNYNLDDNNIFRQHLVQLAGDALNEVDKLWDKLYSKE
jgi:hypothetical protein